MASSSSSGSSLQAFESLLSTTILAPRLSGSKVQELTKLSNQLANQDSQLVTAFYKLNKGLPPCSQARISSLYVFDAIAREARKNVDKAGKGRPVGLLVKMEGVVDSWVEGMLQDGKGGVWAEGREKTRKIIDIWSKTTTFPQPTLERLSVKILKAQPRSTTPNYPPPPPMSPALPPLPPLEGNTGTENGTGQGDIIGADTKSPNTKPGSLPPEIRKLLGISEPVPDSTQQPSGKTVDIATLLANVGNLPDSVLSPDPTPIIASHQPSLVPPNRPPTSSVNQNASNREIPPSHITGLTGLNLDPAQLAELSKLASTSFPTRPPLPPHNHVPPSGHVSGPPSFSGAPENGLPPNPIRYSLQNPINNPPFPGSPPRSFPPHHSPPSHFPGLPGNLGIPSQNSPSKFGPSHSVGNPPFSPPRNMYPTRFPEGLTSRSPPRWERDGRGMTRQRDEFSLPPHERNQGVSHGRNQRPPPPRDRRGKDFPRERGSGWGERGRGRGGGGGGQRHGRDSRDISSSGGLRSPSPDRLRSEFRTTEYPDSLGDEGRVIDTVSREGRVGRVVPIVQEGKDEFGRDLPTPQMDDKEKNEQKEEEGGEEDMALDDEDEDVTPRNIMNHQVNTPNASLRKSVEDERRFNSEGNQDHSGVNKQREDWGEQGQNEWNGQIGRQEWTTQPPVDSQDVQNQWIEQSDQSGANPFQESYPAAAVSAMNGMSGSEKFDFDFSTFNPASPDSWIALGIAFERTTGRQPDQLELMQVLSGDMSVLGSGGMNMSGSMG
ncbi:hypothetical protein TREMEDRAFT_74479 [Tremella mesenterica DSM 1558]|uniref:uncharacterized protein n=1 Tax=Tremella mesenterica (strain ATCC 24925 / CBS 8224 / DSM 1558 / NBRC 9311 / NRRL Y-6157 / RJB 2259-6 / UBC 559-6) TaxID=578456 RepID=UPI0003F49063|nr:uncharacterized protein TREMEDRAFT_74479 [Tremella mesenterica DSM 1558]EIW67679.1 hypothetical protein TREMEDRAFT_74479 [Tremella mesenterica DSM 1558]